MEAAEENLNQALGQLLLEEEDDKGIIVEYCPKKRFHKFNDEIASSPLKVVYRAYDAQQGREVLWHSIKVRGISKKELSRIHQELFLMKSLKHENILGCIDFWVKLERRQIVFITQITNGGCLRRQNQDYQTQSSQKLVHTSPPRSSLSSRSKETNDPPKHSM